MFEELPEPEPEVFEELPSQLSVRGHAQTGGTAPQAAQDDSREWAGRMALLDELCAKEPVFTERQTEWEEHLLMDAEDDPQYKP